MDDQQHAREFLKSAWVEAGWTPEAAAVLASGNDTSMNIQLSAITAALRASPEGFVLVPVEPPTTEMWEVIAGYNLAAIDEIDGDKPNAERHERLGWFLLAWPELLALLAARPQGVKG